MQEANKFDWFVEPSTVSIISILVVLVIAMVNAKRHHLDPTVMYWAGVWGVLGALLGGRVLILLYDPSVVNTDALDWSLFIDGSRTVLGAFVGALLTGTLYLYVKKVDILKYADLAVPAVALGYCGVRIGCYLNGDDFGIVSNLPWAVRFSEGTDIYNVHASRGWIQRDSQMSLSVHPTQLYHVLVGLVGFVLFTRIRLSRKGSVLAVGLVYYAVTRFIIQFYRDDHLVNGAAPETLLDPTQWVCVLFALLGSFLWIRLKVSCHRNSSFVVA